MDMDKINEIMTITASKVVGAIMKTAEPQQLGRGPSGIQTPPDRPNVLEVFWTVGNWTNAFCLRFTMDNGGVETEALYDPRLPDTVKALVSKKLDAVFDYLAVKEAQSLLASEVIE